MANYKILQMGLRGITLFMMGYGLMLNWESHYLSLTPLFIMSGVYGGYAVVTLGLLIEAGLDISSDTSIEVGFLCCGIFLNIISCFLAFAAYYTGYDNSKGSINKGCMSLVTTTVCIADVIFLYFHDL